MNKAMNTIIQGGLGMIVLYAVAKTAYKAGKEVSEEEFRLAMIREHAKRINTKTIPEPETEETEPEKTEIEAEIVTESKFQTLRNLIGKKKSFGHKVNALKKLISDPKSYKIEAYMDDTDIHVKASPNR